jgi:hypothetical protein
VNIDDEEKLEQKRQNREMQKRDEERARDVAETISRASNVLRERMTLDAQTADAELKFSEWMAALATAGLGLTVSTFDKVHQNSWLHAHPRILSSGLILTAILFFSSVALSAFILALFRSYRAGFHETISASSVQEVILLNHVKVIAAQAEVDAIMAGLPAKCAQDFVYSDVVDRKGGGLVRMAYGAKDIPANASYEQEMTAKEFGVVATSLEHLKDRFETIDGEQISCRRKINRFGTLQRTLIGVGYFTLVLCAFPTN